MNADALLVEQSYGETTLKRLSELGHKVVPRPYGSQEFGAAQLIRRLEFGYAAASEPRRDGQAVGF